MSIDRKNQVTGFGPNATAAPLTGFASAAPTPEAAFQSTTDAFRETLKTDAGNFVNIFSQNTSGPLGRQGGTVRLNDLWQRASKIVNEVVSQDIKLTIVKLDHQEHSLYVPAIPAGFALTSTNEPAVSEGEPSLIFNHFSRT
jgi:hypothetical protein